MTAGFHGDEKAGPLTLLEHAAEIVDYAAARGVGLLIYPCINPSGFEAHTRYNLSGERPNNDFLRYEIAPGVWRGELRDGEQFSRIVPAVDGLPKETAALARELDRAPLPAASLDLHQDNFIHGSLFYAYVFGDLAIYRPLMARAGSLVPVLRSSIVDSGYEPGSDVRADAEGFIICPDGSITDRFHRAGVPLRRGDRDHHRDAHCAGRRDQPDLDPRLHRSLCRGLACERETARPSTSSRVGLGTLQGSHLNRQLDFDGGPGARTRGEVEGAGPGAHALAHADDAQVGGEIEGGERRRIEAPPVVPDRQRDVLGVAHDPHLDVVRRGVAEGVGDRLLHHAEAGDLQVGGEARPFA